MSQASPASDKTTPTRSRRKTEIGIVTSDKMSKTRRVVVERLVPHPKYGKMLQAAHRLPCPRRGQRVAHGRRGRDHGDPPVSKLKRWRIVRIVRPGAQQALAGEDEAAKTTS